MPIAPLLRCTFLAATLIFPLMARPAAAADAALIEAAKKEGTVVWYTTQIVNQLAVPMAAAFKKKYGITVSYVRANSTDVALRVINEGKAGKIQVDVVDGTSTPPALRKENLAMKWLPDEVRRFPQQFWDPEGYWVATNIYVVTPGFNTELVKPGTEPRTWNDLLDPKWKGKMAWGASASMSSAPGFIATVLKEMGPDKGRDYLKKLSAQNVAGLQVSARQVLDQVIAGEYQVALQIFNNHAVISAQKGAPSAWIQMQPATVTLSAVSVVNGAPHPNAAKLFLEFLITPEGQQIYRDADYMPADPGVPPTDASLVPDGRNFRAVFFSPDDIDKGMPEWMKLYQEMFR